MSKIAAICGRNDNTPLICTQPIANPDDGALASLSNSAAYIVITMQILIGHGHCPISLLIRVVKVY
jgi:hypothetical protein